VCLEVRRRLDSPHRIGYNLIEADMITFKCRECGKRLFVKDQLSGKRTQCPRCYKYLAIPAVTIRNRHLRGLAMALLTCLILLAVTWMVYYFSNDMP